MMPIVSITIPCYNRAKMLSECLASFIKQSFEDWEIILIDDGSEEDLSFSKYLDYRIKYFKKEHSGIAESFNYALDRVTGKYILAFGSDDLASNEDFLRLMVEEIERRKKYDAVYCDYWWLRPDGVKIRRKAPRAHQNFSNEECLRMMLSRQFIGHGSTLWRRDKHPRYDESLTSAVDWELFLTALESGVRFFHLPLRLWTYRTGHNQEGRSERQKIECDKVLNRRGYKFLTKDRKGIKVCN